MNYQSRRPRLGPPNLIEVLRKGFDSIANHLGVVLFPIALDVFLWLGPRLKVTLLVEEMLQVWREFYAGETLPNGEALQVGQQLWSAIGERLNLFIFLRSYPIGVFSLMAGVQPVRSPLSQPLVIQAGSLSMVVLSWIVCSLIGILAASIYFTLVAQAAVLRRIDIVDAIRSWARNTLHVLLLTVFWLSVIVMVGMPCSCLISFLTFGNLAAAQLAVLGMVALLIWLSFPLVFSPHGIFVYHEDVWVSIKQSIRLTRFAFPNTLLLIVVVFAIGEALDWIWRIPQETSWLMGIGIAGHGFVTSALLASTFIYYREARLWIDETQRGVETVSAS
ncbi:MAG: hypothetical protein RML93_11100 [Anaerolineales bacterium]|nr:hypothetical protein [Anaerolineales bacterium]MCS7246910.1 hypothetical protein [Anaerolineales bacterium]MDW8160721.1 hypothetical protein [Anaerolineales bacterium]MDW8447823.1 hypothetical protein [Anaerolineales bacterium]